jgi:hypothetical protein
MCQIRAFFCFFTMLVSIASLLIVNGCGTTSSVEQPLAPVSKEIYTMGSCDVLDSRATKETCAMLQEFVRYRLFIAGLYEKTEGKAPREIRMKIICFRDVGQWKRAFIGVLAGEEGFDIEVEVIDRENGKIVSNATVSDKHIYFGGSEQSLCASVSDKIVEFLVSCASK